MHEVYYNTFIFILQPFFEKFFYFFRKLFSKAFFSTKVSFPLTI